MGVSESADLSQHLSSCSRGGNLLARLPALYEEASYDRRQLICKAKSLFEGKPAAECVKNTFHHIPSHIRGRQARMVSCGHHELLEVNRGTLVFRRPGHFRREMKLSAEARNAASMDQVAPHREWPLLADTCRMACDAIEKSWHCSVISPVQRQVVHRLGDLVVNPARPVFWDGQDCRFMHRAKYPKRAETLLVLANLAGIYGVVGGVAAVLHPVGR